MTPRLDVVVPVLNEAHVLERSLRQLHAFLEAHAAYDWTIVIAENGSTDGTRAVAEALCGALSRTRLVVLDAPGRGRALREAWTSSDADVLCYLDVDLSTSLNDLPVLVDAIVRDGYDLAVGSRLLPASRVTRSPLRTILSRVYNHLLRATLHVRFSDAQTGFKALRRSVVVDVLPHVRNQSWFLDTELLVLAERGGYRIADIPVTWKEDDDSRVRIIPAVLEDLRGIARLWRQPPPVRKEPQP